MILAFPSPRVSSFRNRARLNFDVLDDRITPALLTVNSLADNIVRDAFLTLREAILLVDHGHNNGAGHRLSAAEQNQISGSFGTDDRIQFDPALNSNITQTMTLRGKELTITRSVIIDASALTSFTITATNASRVFNINNGTSSRIDVSILGSLNAVRTFTLTQGNSTGNGGAIFNAENLSLFACNVTSSKATYGGGIYNTGSLHLSGFGFVQGNTVLPNHGGGGIYNTGSLVVENGFFRFNTATYGAALDNYAPGVATITNSSFDANEATGHDGGGAILNSGQLDLNAVAFTFNSAGSGLGGAIRGHGGTVAGGGGSLFKENSAQIGGALYNDATSSATFTNTNFLRNFAAAGQGGGAIYNRGTLSTDTNIIFEGNRAAFGGAIANMTGNASINNSTFNLNQALGSDGGAALYNSAALLVNACTIMNNTSVGNGGGIANFATLTVTASSITGNRADSDGDGSGQGGGIYASSTIATLLHANTIAGNFVGLDSTTSDLYGGPFVTY